MSFFTRGFLGGLTGANAARKKRNHAGWLLAMYGPEQTNLGDSQDSLRLGSARFGQRKHKTFFNSTQYPGQGGRVYEDTINANPTLYGGGNPVAIGGGVSSGMRTQPILMPGITDPAGDPTQYGLSSLRDLGLGGF